MSSNKAGQSSSTLVTASDLTSVFEHMIEGCVIHDADLRVIGFNPAALTTLGLSSDEIMGRAAADPRWKPLREDGTPCPVEELPLSIAFRERRVVRGRIMGIQRPTGEVRWLIANAFPIEENGRITRAVVTFQDITENQMNELKIRNNEAVLTWLFERLPVGLLLLDGNRRFLKANPAYQQMLGYTEDELRDKTVFDVTHPADMDSTNQVSNDLANHQFINNYQKRKITKDGRRIWVRVTSRRLTPETSYDDGRVISVIEDVTEERLHQDELVRLSSILESTSDLVACARTDGSVFYTNKAWRNAFADVVPNEAHFSRFFPRWAAEKLETVALPRAMKDGSWQGECCICGPNGTEIPVSLVVLGHKPVNGASEYVSTIIRDMSEIKRLHSDLMNAAKLSSFGEMASGVAHEINNPLAVILGRMSKLREDLKLRGKSALEERDFESIERMTTRIAGLVKGLQSLSRSGDRDPIVSVDLSSLISDTLDLCREQFKSNAVRLRRAFFESGFPEFSELLCFA